MNKMIITRAMDDAWRDGRSIPYRLIKFLDFVRLQKDRNPSPKVLDRLSRIRRGRTHCVFNLVLPCSKERPRRTALRVSISYTRSSFSLHTIYFFEFEL